MRNLSSETAALHVGYNPQTAHNCRTTPIYLSSSYVFNNSEHAAKLFALEESGYIYTRLNNPTNDLLEQRLAALEGGVGTVVTASGASAVSTTLLTLLQSGDHIVASNSLYGGTYNLLNVTLPKFSINTTFVDADYPENFAKAIRPNTRVIFAEALGNPKLDIMNVEAIAAIAHKNKIPLIIDNTLPTPALFNPIEKGADIVIHSLTKYICGNGTALGGAVIDAGNFNWNNGKFPQLTQPSDGYHGLIYHEAFKEAAFIAKIRLEGLRDLGGALSPFNAFQILQGLETLSIRMERLSKTALSLAQWLQQHPQVAWVHYPGLESDAYHSLAKKYLPKGQSGMIVFGVKGGYQAAEKVVNHTQLFSLVANIGDTKSLIIHPASTTHQQLTEAQQRSTGVTPDLIRLSVGLEHVDDLKNDLQQAFQHISH